jgi:hypothetical protein
LDVFESKKGGHNVAFISTTTRELKKFLANNDTEDDTNVLIGIENFRRQYPSIMHKKIE